MRKTYLISIVIVIIVLIIGLTGGIVAIKLKNNITVIDGGVVKNHRLEGYSEKIKSTNINYFFYKGSGFEVLSELSNKKLHILFKGNYINADDSYILLDYYSSDLSLLSLLQEIIEKNSICLNNGYEYEVAGLPEGFGDEISVIYESGEKIWKYSNQTNTIKKDAIKEIYDAFRNYSIKNGYSYN